MTTMKLNVVARIVILQNLPEQGSMVEMMAKRNVRKHVDFTSEEMDQLAFETTEAGLTWKNVVEDKEVEFSETEMDLLKRIVKTMDENGVISEQILDFVETVMNA